VPRSNNFGLAADDIFFFQQGTLPCFDAEGAFLMEGAAAEKVAQAPDGNGGIYKALHTAKSGEGKGETAMAHMERHKVKGVMVFAVDNAMCKVGDPAFVGYCLDSGAELGVKVVPKANAEEKVGHLCMVDGKYQVIEYTEIGERSKETLEDGATLKYNAGSVCIHYYSFDFLNVKCNMANLPKTYHVAEKEIKHSKVVEDKDGQAAIQAAETTKKTGVKLEIFIFDVFDKADPSKVAVLEAARAEEFSPVKNKNEAGAVDCPETAKNLITALHKSWLVKAGATFKGDGPVEVCPLVSYGGEGLEALSGKELDVTKPGGLHLDEAAMEAATK
jgi:UDP-N-acetylglucosamine/UDP-N-acetylgalactosamine diphosphorylase